MFSTLVTLIAVSLQLQRDRELAAAVLRDRDRTLGRARKLSLGRPVVALRAWVDAVASDEDRATTRRAATALQTSALVLVVLGLLFGAGAAAAVYSYEGTRPINILPAIATFVVLPVLLLLPLLLQMLPFRVPGLETVRETLAMLGTGLLALAMRVLGQRHRELVQIALGRGRAHQRVFAPLQKWTLLSWSQSFALAFHLGAIAWFAARVLITDLSFTWSTTAEFVTAERVHALTQALSAPWSVWLSSASPSLADVRATQYFRLGEGSVVGAADPALLGRWWSFLLMSMVVYGLAPRVLTAVVCMVARARTVRWTLLHLPDVDDTLDRLTRGDVRTQSPEPEVHAPGRVEDPPPAEALEHDLGDAIVVRWSRIELDAESLTRLLRNDLGVDVTAALEAGAGQSLDHDAQVRASVAERLHGLTRGQVVVLVKAWEPATMEAMDFLTDLRAAVGEGVRIVVVALRLHAIAAIDTEDRDVAQWRRRCVALGDPWLRVVGIDTPAEATS